MCMNYENVSVKVTSRWIAVGVDKTFLPKDEEFDEFFIDEEEYESAVDYGSDGYEGIEWLDETDDEYEGIEWLDETDDEYEGIKWMEESDDEESIEWCELDDDEDLIPSSSPEEFVGDSDEIFHCCETSCEYTSDVFEDGIPVFEGRIHDHKMDERNSWLIYDMLRYAEDPELVCMTLALMACSFYRWKAVNVGFVISNLKNVICEIYNIDEEEFCRTWGRGRMRELINSISELVYFLRYKLIKCDDEEIDYMLVNSNGGEFAYTLFANVFGNKVFNPYDTDSFDYGDPRSVDYRSLV